MIETVFFLTFRLILAIWASYRLARVLAHDEITSGLRAWLGKRASGKPRYSSWWFISELVSCPECAGVWIAGGFALALSPIDMLEFVLFWFTIAGVQVFLENKT